MNINNQQETINDLPDFSKETLFMKTSDELFWNLKESDSLKDFLEKEFDKICYIQIHPKDFGRNTWNEILDDIIKKYLNYAEHLPIDIMFFKLNEQSLTQAEKIYEEMKDKHWDIIVMSETKRMYMVWFFWWTSWRTNQTFINQIKLELWDKVIKLIY